MNKLCRDNHLIWPMEAGGGPNFSLINPTASHDLLLRKLRADFVLTKDPQWPYERQVCGKMHREGSRFKTAGVH